MDRPLSISTAKSRFTLRWSQRETTWAELANRLSHTTMTSETAEDYSHMNKNDQDNIKDVGGFVGGKLKDGYRRAECVMSRSVITLDADFAKPDFWKSFTCLNDWACCIYSTHKCKPGHLRLRLVAPLLRDVTPDEYIALTMKIAYLIGMDQFDDTTYQPGRMMYLPSTSRDAAFVYERQDGPWLDPDEILGMYDNWRDVETWPHSSRTDKQKMSLTKEKKKDPRTINGLAGAFCRTYGITEAIAKYMPEIYVPANRPDRYTYAPGTGYAGVLVYDDTFVFSEHGTDPASMQECNAYDMVRIHLFGDQDKTCKPDTPFGKLPSVIAMNDLVRKDADVMKLMDLERINSAKTDFDGVKVTDPADPATDWLTNLTHDKRGIEATIDNFRLIIMNDPNLKSIAGLNEFSGNYVVSGKLPWDNSTRVRNWTDNDDAGLRCHIGKIYKLDGKDKIYDAVSIVMNDRKFNPIVDYLKELKWDEIPRLDTLFIDYLGAEDTKYTRAVTRKSLVAAVRRAYVPGEAYDTMPILVGRQGVGKSLILRKLGKQWFSDSLVSVQGKDAFDALSGVWIMEMAELTATKRSDVEASKQFISKNNDIYRQAYGRRTEVHPRRCVFFGTTNDREFLRDTSGNRRYLPIDCEVVKPVLSVLNDLNDATVDQIWAEAVKRYHDGETVFLDSSLVKQATEMQNSHMADDGMAGDIEEYLNTLIPETWRDMTLRDRVNFFNSPDITMAKGTVRRNNVCAREILCECLNVRKENISTARVKQVNEVMDKMPGWKRHSSSYNSGAGYGYQRGFIRIDQEDKEEDNGSKQEDISKDTETKQK